MTPHWRLIEAELMAWVKAEQYEIDEDNLGDKVVLMSSGLDCDMNLTSLAHHLAQSFVPKSVTVKA